MVWRKVQNVQVYAITGWKGHGKDTFANSIVGFNKSFVITHFAAPLKRMSGRVFGLTEAQMNDPKLKEAPLEKPIVMDLFLAQMREETGLDIQPANMIAYTPRQVLQYFGTEYVRKVQDDFWVQKIVEFVRNHPKKKVLIPDCRFPNEAAAVWGLGGKIIRVLRLDVPLPEDAHPSEREIENITPDLLIGKVSSDMSLQTRIAKLVAMNRFDSALIYDYRSAQRAVSLYAANGSLESCASELRLRHKDPGPIKFVLRYYGVPLRQGGASKVAHRIVDGVDQKFCPRCKSWKATGDFNLSAKSWDGLCGICRLCASQDNKDRYQKYSKIDSLEAIYKVCKKAARYRGKEFSLTLDDVRGFWSKQDGKCFYSGADLTTVLKSPTKVTFDRVDSSKGYTIENTVLCAYVVNLMKGSLSTVDFKEWVARLHNHMGQAD